MHAQPSSIAARVVDCTTCRHPHPIPQYRNKRCPLRPRSNQTKASTASASAWRASSKNASCRSRRTGRTSTSTRTSALDVLETCAPRRRPAGCGRRRCRSERGGQGFGSAWPRCYEEMGRSIFGPVVFNCAAPDDGNMMVLEKVAHRRRRRRAGCSRSSTARCARAFAMTEPHPGAGSDPSMMLHARRAREGDRWVIDGRKWFITGAGVAQHFILIARTSRRRAQGADRLPVRPRPAGWRIVRRIPIMGPEEHGGHCELVFDGLRDPGREPADGGRRRAEGDPDPPRHRRGSPIACAGSAWPSARSRSPAPTSHERDELRQRAGRARGRAVAAGRGGDGRSRSAGS